jgi:hypothetical protein
VRTAQRFTVENPLPALEVRDRMLDSQSRHAVPLVRARLPHGIRGQRYQQMHWSDDLICRRE